MSNSRHGVPHFVALGLYETGSALRGARVGGRPREARGVQQMRRAQPVADVGGNMTDFTLNIAKVT